MLQNSRKAGDSLKFRASTKLNIDLLCLDFQVPNIPVLKNFPGVVVLAEMSLLEVFPGIDS